MSNVNYYHISFNGGLIPEILRANFDPIFYRFQYEHLSSLSDEQLLRHFFYVGWFEGLNPNAWFDTSSYLEMNEDVRTSGMNPLLHFMLSGRQEGRLYRMPVPLKAINEGVFGRADVDWVSVIEKIIDTKFYKSQIIESVPPHLSFSAHYCFRGWKMGLLPSAEYSTQGVSLNPTGFSHLVPPAIASAATTNAVLSQEAEASTQPELNTAYSRSRKDETRARTKPVDLTNRLVRLSYEKFLKEPEQSFLLSREIENEAGERPEEIYADDVKDVAACFDRAFYIRNNSDVKDAGVDPIEHYYYTGWREGRDPTPWFSTSYYLATNPDVASAQVNPFWHYVVAGQHEGRAAKKDGAAGKDILANLASPQDKVAGYTTPAHVRLNEASLIAIFEAALSNSEGLVFSISHDCYTNVTGGIQIFISDEQLLFNQRKYTYLHSSPLRGSLLLKEETAEFAISRIVVDGKVVGAATDLEIEGAMLHFAYSYKKKKIFVVHCALGHSVDGLLRVRRALNPDRSFFWLHDYSSLCSGFNLLRNDIKFCHAPPLSSEACRICIYGTSRALQLDLMGRLFQEARFVVVAPSESARKLWEASTSLYSEGIITVEHCSVTTNRLRKAPRDPDKIGLSADPVRVAYLGFPVYHKGWAVFERIMKETRHRRGYKFFHFASPSSLYYSDQVVSIEVDVTSSDREAMTRLLAENNIDLVVMAAAWPETFSYVTYEALAAGCDIVTLADSGNVTATIARTGRGLVFDSPDDLIGFFVLHHAVGYARARARYPISLGHLTHTGTTAALAFADR
ncbi:hypothetical protein MKK68_25330 [Methylobacterium sp. E-016]|uniref:hypothetical protein n=1 Tax=Methylobacterium sp. E-016 TaxID=2836556 RepID=UPI001FBB7C68|nr:hypothetical protein [Methylobacterium sp. E-016]MCJ2078918.1 hypothetical protein [Methylobacterium sp. E-016]